MDMQAALRARMVADDELRALVGENVFWVQASQGTGFPRVVLQTVSDERLQNYKGYQELRSPRVQIDIYSDIETGYAQCRAILEAVIAAISTPETSNGIVFQRPQVVAERDGFERTDAQKLHRISLDVVVWWAKA